jgi:hypothetical protein
MTEDTQVIRGCALLNAAVARAAIRAMGMQAENMIRYRRGEALAYDEAAFIGVIKEETIGYNSAIRMTRPD